MGCGGMIAIIGGVLWYFTSFAIGLPVVILGIVLFIALSVIVDAPQEAAYKAECARVDQEHKQNVQNFYDERRRILSEVAKYN